MSKSMSKTKSKFRASAKIIKVEAYKEDFQVWKLAALVELVLNQDELFLSNFLKKADKIIELEILRMKIESNQD